VSTATEWRWVDLNGEQHVVSFDELARALSTEALPAFVLVWHTGWSEWLPAANVPEFTPALGLDRTGPPSIAPSSPAATVAPAPALSAYGAHAPPGVTTLLRPKRDEAPSTLPPPAPLSDQRAPRPPVPGIPAPPAFMSQPLIPMRDVMPTLADEEPVRSKTLRPAGALPPPPRAMPQAKVPVFDAAGEALEVVAVPEAIATAEPFGEQPSAANPFAATLAGAPAFDMPAPRPRAPARVTPVTAPLEATRPEATPSVVARRKGAPAPGPSRQSVTVATSIGLLLPGGLLLAAALMRPPRKPEPAPPVATAAAASAVTSALPLAAAAPTAAPTAASAAPTPAAGCVLARPAARLAESAFVGVPVLLSTTPDGARAAIGFAASKDHALGLTVDPAALTTTATFDETVADSTTLGVVPLVGSGTLGFVVDRAAPALAYARTVDAPKPFSIGVSSAGFARAVGGVVDVVWPGKSKAPAITTPRIASIPGFGHAVAFRHGGQEGKVLVGWLHEDGSKLSPLKAVATDAALVGTPTISANDTVALVAFASKTAPAEAWRIELSVAPHGSAPGRASVFALPPGGPGGEGISPSTERLADGRFLLQWTEGSAGNRAVRAQVVSAGLVPVGDAITLSAPEQNAGQGALWVHGGRAIGLFLVKKDTSHELWGASLRCP
jgi:hypothetical protein